ncbi:hypothetical protein JQX13_25745 [Archangium violaceum]|uniref:hypothetical protein n=1 Tax=Archangium violaceum TaxID=83451 RepID=UPI00193B7A7E|nr:hypothetical protein [Archangium violaceum]QRK13129.1 hypothetical protein JQX13_25745 [Archangium violaceum]
MRRHLAMVFAIALFAGPAHACTNQKHETPKATTMITYEAQPANDEFPVAGELRLRLRIVNTQGADVEVPDPTSAGSQPVYVLVGPEFPRGQSFTRFALEHRPTLGKAPPAPPPPAMLRIAAGTTWEGVVGLGPGLRILQPGDYSLVSRFEHGGRWVESAASVVRIRAAVPSSIHVGVGLRPQKKGEGEGAFLRRGEDGNELFSFLFHEVRPDITEPKIGEPIERELLGPNATDVGVPWRNSPFFDELMRFIVWREGRSVKVVSSTGDISSIELPVEPRALVRPPLKATGGPAEVLAVTNEELHLVSFAMAAEPAEPPIPKLAWRVTLPARPDAIAAALGPASHHSPRYVAFAAQREHGVELFVAKYTSGGALGTWRSVVVADAGRLVDPSAFGVFVDADEHVYVGALTVTEKEGSLACAWTEARWDADGAPRGTPGAMPLGPLAEKPEAGALLFVEKDGKLVRREALVAVKPEEGRLLRWKEPRGLVPVSVPGRPTSPIILVPGDTATYILYFDTMRGIYAEPL